MEDTFAGMAAQSCNSAALRHLAEDQSTQLQEIVRLSGKFQASNESGPLHRATDAGLRDAGLRARRDWLSAPTARRLRVGGSTKDQRHLRAVSLYSGKDIGRCKRPRGESLQGLYLYH